jgi:hypothetical protein
LKPDVPVSLGDLQPNRGITLHVLAGYLSDIHSVPDIKKSLVFSADELGRAAYKFPIPFYQQMRRRRVIGNSLFAMGLAFWIAIGIYEVLLKK